MTPTEFKEVEFKEETDVLVRTVGKKPVSIVTSRTRVARKAKSGMFDAPEIVAVSVAGAALLTVIFAYFFMLLPAREEFKNRELERSQKQAQLLDLQAKAKLSKDSAAGTVDLVSSVDRFETSFLPLPANGNAALYQRLNELIRTNNLKNTAGPEYASLESVDPSRAAKTENRSSNGKQAGIFPGTYVTVTVEGSYGSLRHFIGDLENTRQFLVINAVEIESNGNGESSSNTGNAMPANAPRAVVIPNNPAGMPSGMPSAQPNSINPRATNVNPTGIAPAAAAAAAAPIQTKRGSVSLQLEMAAYFRRPLMAGQN